MRPMQELVGRMIPPRVGGVSQSKIRAVEPGGVQPEIDICRNRDDESLAMIVNH